MDRKEFLKTTCLVCGALAAASLIDACKKTATTTQAPDVDFTLDLSASANSALNNVGGSVVNSKVIIIRTAVPLTASSFTALTQICTHAGCDLAYYNKNNTVGCPCHGGVFNINGNVIAGPPPGPLRKYNVSLNGNSLRVY